MELENDGIVILALTKKYVAISCAHCREHITTLLSPVGVDRLIAIANDHEHQRKAL